MFVVRLGGDHLGRGSSGGRTWNTGAGGLGLARVQCAGGVGLGQGCDFARRDAGKRGGRSL